MCNINAVDDGEKTISLHLSQGFLPAIFSPNPTLIDAMRLVDCLFDRF